MQKLEFRTVDLNPTIVGHVDRVIVKAIIQVRSSSIDQDWGPNQGC